MRYNLKDLGWHMQEVSEELYARFISAVNSNFKRFEGRKYAEIAIGNLLFYFRIIAFNDYDILWVGENNG